MKTLKNIFVTLLVIGMIGAGVWAIYEFIIPDELVIRIKEGFGIHEDSGITGEAYTFDPEYYPYYNFLSENGKKLYSQIYANAKELHTTFVPVVEITASEVNNVVKAVYQDHAELFWMDSGYSYKYIENDICVQITLEFNETIDYIEEARKQFEDKANEIISAAAALDSDYEKEKYVFRAIIDSTEYDTSASLHQSPYSALVNGKSVCAGYSRAFQYIMTQLHIPTYYCAGMTEGHAWNIVKLENGYYNVDLTWADRNDAVNSYFNQTDKSLGYSHKRSGYSVLLPNCKATKYQDMK